MRSKLCLILSVLTILNNCSTEVASSPGENQWVKIVNTEKPVDFCRIDSISNGYILTISHSPAISGGFGSTIAFGSGWCKASILCLIFICILQPRRS